MKQSLALSLIAHAILFGMTYAVFSKQSAHDSSLRAALLGPGPTQALQPVEVRIGTSDHPTASKPTSRIESARPKNLANPAPPKTPLSPLSLGGAGSSPNPDSPSSSLTLEQASYLNTLREALIAHVRYPHLAQSRRQSGTTRVRFTLNREGEISQIELAESSHFDTLDEAALESVRHLGRFKPIPLQSEKPNTNWTVTVPIDFKLTDSP